jgi:hypothetical protein
MRRSIAALMSLLVVVLAAGCGAVSGDPDAGPIKSPVDAGAADAAPAACVLDHSSIDHCTL